MADRRHGQLAQQLLRSADERLSDRQAVEIYGDKYPIEDCRSGACFPGYLWWNGYIPANQINSVDRNGKPNGVMGVPANYKPAAAPLIPLGSHALRRTCPPARICSGSGIRTMSGFR